MRRRTMLVGAGASVLVAGCDTPARLAPLPAKLRGAASFSGLPPDTRVVLDGSDDAVLGRIATEGLRREFAYAEKTGVREIGPANYLAISGGGENGAYGAGLLTGWTALGTRPEFKGVTGVSTGALIAPFAFLGPAYDEQLERFYTTIEQERRDEVARPDHGPAARLAVQFHAAAAPDPRRAHAGDGRGDRP